MQWDKYYEQGIV